MRNYLKKNFVGESEFLIRLQFFLAMILVKEKGILTLTEAKQGIFFLFFNRSDLNSFITKKSVVLFQEVDLT